MAQYEHEVSELQDLASRLNGLVEEFDHLGRRMHGFEADVGHHDVAKALHGFAENWSDKREKLLGELRELSGYVKVAADTYAGVESDLTEQFTMPPPQPASAVTAP